MIDFWWLSYRMALQKKKGMMFSEECHVLLQMSVHLTFKYVTQSLHVINLPPNWSAAGDTS